MSYSVCSCIRTDCWHEKGQCDEPPAHQGGVCTSCRLYEPPKLCPTCGQPVQS